MTHPRIDLQMIARETLRPVQDFLAEDVIQAQSTRPRKKTQRSEWLTHYQLIDFTVPALVNSPSIKKKFKICIQCKDRQEDTHFNKTIFFGQDDDYVFTKDKSTRLKKLMNMKQKDNPLHPDYWRAHLCFSTPDFKQNCKTMLTFLLNKRFNQKQPMKRQAIRSKAQNKEQHTKSMAQKQKKN